MKAKEIAVGMKVFMKVSGNVVPVRVDSIREVSNYKGRSSTVYACTNLKTGRPCSARSASKFRGPVPDMYKGDAREIALRHGRDLNRKQASEGKQHADPTAAPAAAEKPGATTGVPTAVPSPTIEGKQGSDPTTPSTTPTATAAASTPAKPVSCDHLWIIRPDNGREYCPKCGAMK